MKTKLLIFGITGDLSRRKLLPALRDIVQSDTNTSLSIIGVSRREVDIPSLIKDSTGDTVLIDCTSVFTMDLAVGDDYVRLKDFISLQSDEQLVIYLSVPPSAAADIVDFLGAAGLNTPTVKILFEKPFGFDLESAQDFVARTNRFFTEEQIYRIDHYMAKEIAAHIIQLRRDAQNHHHHWSNESVKRVSVVASEKIGIEGRAQFYEQTGALRDFIQGHLMQLLALVLITKPGTKDLPMERFTALQHILPADPGKAVRGQYEGYQNEAENPGSTVETLVALNLESDDPRWRGVELRLITGKALSEKRSYIKVEYLDGSEDVFEEGKVLALDKRGLNAYERVLLEAIAGNKAIFTTSPEVLRAWEIVAPVQNAWSMSGDVPQLYPYGTDIEHYI